MKGKLIWELIDDEGNVIERSEHHIPIVTDGINACIDVLFKREPPTLP